MATFMPKRENGLLSIFFAQFHPVWNNLSSVTKNDSVGHFSHSVFITELEFLVKNDFRSKMENLKIYHFLTWSISRWIWKFYIFDQKPFSTKNSNSVMKTVWEKYPILSFLVIELKLFQIGRNCAKKIDNNPFSFFGIKVAINQ